MSKFFLEMFRCAVISKPAPGSTNTYYCKGMEGRYINIVLPGKRKFLILCEVKVSGQPSKRPALNGDLNLIWIMPLNISTRATQMYYYYYYSFLEYFLVNTNQQRIFFSCKIFLHCPETNIATGGIATQSSQYTTASADKAIDGNSNSNWNYGSCSTTLNSMTPWWRLDLLRVHKINTVTVTISTRFRGINGAEIRIGNSLDSNGNTNPRWGNFEINLAKS